MAAILEVPETLKVVIPEIAPLITALPVIPKVLLPTHVELLVVVDAVIAVAPKTAEPPTAPVKVAEPVPAAMVSVRVVVSLFSVPPNSTLLLVVVKVALDANLTAPVYV